MGRNQGYFITACSFKFYLSVVSICVDFGHDCYCYRSFNTVFFIWDEDTLAYCRTLDFLQSTKSRCCPSLFVVNKIRASHLPWAESISISKDICSASCFSQSFSTYCACNMVEYIGRSITGSELWLYFAALVFLC